MIRNYYFYFDCFLIFLEQNRFNKYLKDMFFDILKKEKEKRNIFEFIFSGLPPEALEDDLDDCGDESGCFVLILTPSTLLNCVIRFKTEPFSRPLNSIKYKP